MSLETVAGITQCTVSRPGAVAINLNVNTTAQVRCSRYVRETKMGASGRAVAKKTPQPGRIVLGCLDSREMVHQQIGEWDTCTVTLTTAAGRIFVCNGHQVGESELDVIEGEFGLEFEGEVEEII
jgi:hypothetical protein